MSFQERVEYHQASLEVINYLRSSANQALDLEDPNRPVSPVEIREASTTIATTKGLDPKELEVMVADSIYQDPSSDPEIRLAKGDHYALDVEKEVFRQGLAEVNYRKSGTYFTPYRHDHHNLATPLRNDPEQAPNFGKVGIEVQSELLDSGNIIYGYLITLHEVPVFGLKRELLAQAKSPEQYRAVQLFLKQFNDTLQKYDSRSKISGEINFTETIVFRDFPDEGIKTHAKIISTRVNLAAGNEIKGLRIHGEETRIDIKHSRLDSINHQLSEEELAKIPPSETITIGRIDDIPTAGLIAIDPIALLASASPAAIGVTASMALGKVIISVAAKKTAGKVLLAMSTGSGKDLGKKIVDDVVEEVGDGVYAMTRLDGRLVDSKHGKTPPTKSVYKGRNRGDISGNKIKGDTIKTTGDEVPQVISDSPRRNPFGRAPNPLAKTARDFAHKVLSQKGPKKFDISEGNKRLVGEISFKDGKVNITIDTQRTTASLDRVNLGHTYEDIVHNRIRNNMGLFDENPVNFAVDYKRRIKISRTPVTIPSQDALAKMTPSARNLAEVETISVKYQLTLDRTDMTSDEIMKFEAMVVGGFVPRF